MSGADAEEQADEAASLDAIFGEDVEYDAASSAYRVFLPSKAAEAPVLLRVLLPASYPSACGPVMELEAAHAAEQQLAAAVRHMEGMFVPGQVCLFDCIEWLREQMLQWQEAAADAGADAADAHAAAALAGAVQAQAQLCSDGSSGSDDWGDQDWDPSLHELPESTATQRERAGAQAAADADLDLMQQMRAKIVSGEPMTERKSTFQAHVAPVTQVGQVRAVVAVLLESNKIRHATHNIMAYRIAVPGRDGVFLQDCDDDGEAAAGGRLLHLLQVADVRDAVVMVSRWFGGVLLGPSRFSLINNTARQLLEQTGFIRQQRQQQGSSKQGASKKGTSRRR